MQFEPLPAPRYKRLVFGAVAFLISALTFSAFAQQANSASRWVNASDVNMRTEPKLDSIVIQKLGLDTEVKWLGEVASTNFCQVEYQGGRGYVACQFLGLKSVAAPADANPNHRWISGTGVVLRAQPSKQAEVVTRLSLNTIVLIKNGAPQEGYCQVSTVPPAPILEGFTACQYLASRPFNLDSIAQSTLENGQPNPLFDPIKRFWMKPAWSELEAYGMHLVSTRLTKAQSDDLTVNRPADPEYERMKSQLAKGIYGDRPKPWIPWDTVKRISYSPVAPTERSQALASLVRDGGLYGYGFDRDGVGGVLSSQPIALVKAIELPAISPSLFLNQDEVAPPTDSIEALSGRFQIIHTYKTGGRQLGKDNWAPGAWDVGSVTKTLTQPIYSTSIYRDGRLNSQATQAKITKTVWGAVDNMCDGWAGLGFEWGDSDESIWRGSRKNRSSGEVKKELRVPAGSLLKVYTRKALPREKGEVRTIKLKLDREATGFSAATQIQIDLDGDGVPDLLAWEGVGQGPSSVDWAAGPDDAYHRIFFVNIAGKWHLFAVDTFSYGCGC